MTEAVSIPNRDFDELQYQNHKHDNNSIIRFNP